MRVSLPEPFLNRMKRLLGNDFERYAESMDLSPEKAIWLQRERMGPEHLLARKELELERIPGMENGYRCFSEKPGNHPLHFAGAYYVQDPSAMLPVAASPLREGMNCLDLCASPGGKSAQIRDRIGKDGFLVSNEIMPARCKTLAGNLERIGAVNTLITNADAKRMSAWFPSFFDFVLVDAPCSGEGMFRKYPESVGEWNEKLPAYCAERQRSLLSEAVKMLAPEGFLLYSTCTFSQEEDEEIVRWALSEYPSLTLQPFPDWLNEMTCPGIDMPECRRVYPFMNLGEGQFMALLKKSEGGKRGEPAFRDARGMIGRAEMDAAVSFLENTVEGFEHLPLCAYGGHLIAADFPVPGTNVYAPGVNVGLVQKGRLIPHHAMFKAYGKMFLNRLETDPDSPLLDAYLRGSEFPCALPDGWGAVSVLGVPVGGMKVVGGQAKNHYPKGLRIQG